MRRRLTVLGAALIALVVVAAAVVVGVRWWHDHHRTELAQAIGWAPDGTARYSWTDWAAVRQRLHSTVSASSTPAQLADFLSDGYDADLTSESAMPESSDVLQEKYGVSPADVDWELLAQGSQGSVLLLGLPDSLSTGDLGDTFEGLGYERPSSATGVWLSTESQLAEVGAGGSLSPQFNYLALDAGRHLMMASDNAAYLRAAVDGSSDLPDDQGLRDVVDAVGSPLSAAVYTGDYTCKALAMSDADEDDQATGDQLITAAGGVHPLTGFAMARETTGDLTVAFGLETDDQARADADSRSELAAGAAPGQGGTFPERFRLGPVTADGRVVTMDLKPVDESPVLSDLSNGPVLFASC